MIPYGCQDITKDDIDAVTKILESEYLTQGPMVPTFEEEISKYVNARYTVATNSATSALHIACIALEIGPGDLVWTTPITFVASANCVLFCGGSIDFVDIDPNSFNLCVASLEEKLITAKNFGALPKALIAVHFGGQSCDMEKIWQLSQKYGFKVIEDASHAIGGSYQSQKIGSCKYSDITIFSFHPVKIITTAEGGVATTNSLIYENKMRLARSHGITSDESGKWSTPSNEIWNYKQVSLGYNYRLTDMQAAMGISQLSRIDAYVQSRNSKAKVYDIELSNLPIHLPKILPYNYSSFHLYVIRIPHIDNLLNQKKCFEYLRSSKIMVNLHYIPVYLHPYYQSLGFKRGYCPNAEKYFTEAITLPLYPTLKAQDQNFVIDVLSNFINKKC